jgi:hypothetical protein
MGCLTWAWAMLQRGRSDITFQVLPTSMRSCNGHAPLITQERRARAGQEVQPRRVGPCAAPNSSKAHGKRKECVKLHLMSWSPCGGRGRLIVGVVALVWACHVFAMTVAVGDMIVAKQRGEGGESKSSRKVLFSLLRNLS